MTGTYSLCLGGILIVCQYIIIDSSSYHCVPVQVLGKHRTFRIVSKGRMILKIQGSTSDFQMKLSSTHVFLVARIYPILVHIKNNRMLHWYMYMGTGTHIFSFFCILVLVLLYDTVDTSTSIVRFECGKKVTFWNPPPPRGVIYEK